MNQLIAHDAPRAGDLQFVRSGWRLVHSGVTYPGPVTSTPRLRPPRPVRLVVRHRGRGSRRLLVHQQPVPEGALLERTVVVIFVRGIVERASLVEATRADEARSPLAVTG